MNKIKNYLIYKMILLITKKNKKNSKQKSNTFKIEWEFFKNFLN